MLSQCTVDLYIRTRRFYFIIIQNAPLKVVRITSHYESERAIVCVHAVRKAQSHVITLSITPVNNLGYNLQAFSP
jgi:hypothetical protein